MKRVALSLLCVAILCVQSFAVETGFYDASVKREISAPNSSSPSTLEYGKTPTENVQALFKWDVNLPPYAEVTKVEFRFRMNLPTYIAQVNRINKVWDASSTWASLGNGLSGSEIGPQAASIFPAPCCGNRTVSGSGGVGSGIVADVQRAADGIIDWQGLVCWAPNNNSGTCDGIFSYELNIHYNNRVGGDANGDECVTFADFLILSANYDKCGQTWADGDFTGDGCVSFADFLILQTNFDNCE